MSVIVNVNACTSHLGFLTNLDCPIALLQFVILTATSASFYSRVHSKYWLSVVVQEVIHEHQWHPSRLADMQLSLLIWNSSSIVAMVELGVLGIGYHQQWLSHIISYFQQNNQYSNSMSEGSKRALVDKTPWRCCCQGKGRVAGSYTVHFWCFPLLNVPALI